MRNNIVFAVIFTAVFCCLLCSIVSADEQLISDDDVRFLLNGVDGIGQSGVPGPLCVYGQNAAAVIAGNTGSTKAALAAAAKFGKGRVFAFGHDGYLNPNMLNGNLFRNTLQWLAKNKKNAVVAVVNYPLEQKIKALNYEVMSLKSPNVNEKRHFDILIIDGSWIPPEQVDSVRKFIKDGGGLLTALTGWGWLQISGKHDLQTENTGNLLLAPMGIVWCDGYLGAAERREGKGYYDNGFFPAPQEPLKVLNINNALTLLLQQESNTAAPSGSLSEKDIAQAWSTVENGLASVPQEQFTMFKVRFNHRNENLYKASVPQEQFTMFKDILTLMKREVIPSEKNKLDKNKDISDILAVSMQTEKYIKSQVRSGLPKTGIPALPAANDFPGSVPKDAKIVSKGIKINTAIPDWHSTGLYAPAGKTVTVSVPKEILQTDNKSKIGVRIGCHTDSIRHHQQWSRYPEISIRIPVQSEITKIANPFGGLIYIDVPRNYKQGTFTAKINGGVEAPYFVLGKTTADEWKKIRNAPAPWGELASDKVILSVPSSVLRDCDEPEKTLEFWNKVFDADAELCGRTSAKDRPERITCDRQISAGYMHSGYPVMTWMDVQSSMVNAYSLPASCWGFFHEFGHNHQSGDWTFDGTGEVTVNLFTLYCCEKIFQCKPSQALQTCGQNYTLAAIKQIREKYFADGSPFEKWKSNPFLALFMYVDLQEQFGWNAFKNVFRKYLELPDNERPKNDAEKRDQWLVRMSRETGRNLAPYFVQWGIPVSDEAKNAVKDLPVWQPY